MSSPAELRIALEQARYALRDFNRKQPGCGFDKLANACREAADFLAREPTTTIIRDLRDALRDATNFMDLCHDKEEWPDSIEDGTALAQAEDWLAEYGG